MDLAQPRPDDWRQSLQDIDAVINAVGIFHEQGKQSFDAIHVKGAIALFDAAVDAGVARIVQISALGADARADTGYQASKGLADERLAALPLRATSVRPSLVFAAQGRSTQWFLQLAAAPLTPLPAGGVQPVQPVHLRDLCDAVVMLLDEAAPPPVLDVVGPQPMPLADYLRTLGGSMGTRVRVAPVPVGVAMLFAHIAARWPGSLVTPDALRLLQRGNVGDAGALASLLGRAPRPAQGFIDPSQAQALRQQAQLRSLLPLLRVALAAMWLVTAWVSVFVYPLQASLDLLQRAHVPAAWAPPMLYAAALADALLGLAMLPARWRRQVYALQFALIVFYTAVISLFLPEFWAHPYGPVLKNLPLLALIGALYQLDTPHGPDRR